MQSKARDNVPQAPPKLYRIGELVRYSPLSRQTIHNYTIMGLIHEEQWTEGGHRLYGESVFEELARIIELRKTKSLYQIRQILSEQTEKRRSLKLKAKNAKPKRKTEN